MKKTFIRILAMVLAVLMVVPFLFACKKDDEDADGENTAVTVPDGADPESEQVANLPEMQDFGGVEFKVVIDGLSDLYAQYMVATENSEKSTDAVSIAMFKRDALLENYFNIDIKVNNLPGSYNMLGQLEKNSLGGVDFADITYSVAGHVMGGSLQNGWVLDLNTMEELKLDASYYDQRIQEEYNIEGRLFALEGDYTIYDEMRTHVVTLNKTIYDDLKYNDTYGSPYQMVRDGKWTIDTMLEMIKDTSDFSTQGANMNTESQWGMLSEGAFLYSVYLGTGSKLLYSDGGTLITPWADDTKYNNDYNIFDRLIPALYGNNEINFVGEKDDVTGKNYSTSMDMFANGQALFYTGTLSGVINFRGMTDVFGILPVPKYTEGQEFYYSWCSTMAHTPLMVPATVKVNDHEARTASIIEGMAYFSKYASGTNQSVLDAFYENMTYSQLCREPEDYEMLELIFSQKTFDLDYALNLANYVWKLCEDVPAQGWENYSLASNLPWYRRKLTDPVDAEGSANKLQPFLDKFTEAMNTLYPEG